MRYYSVLLLFVFSGLAWCESVSSENGKEGKLVARIFLAGERSEQLIDFVKLNDVVSKAGLIPYNPRVHIDDDVLIGIKFSTWYFPKDEDGPEFMSYGFEVWSLDTFNKVEVDFSADGKHTDALEKTVLKRFEALLRASLVEFP